ncbi:hypothetical protein QMA69_26525 [Burkholderia pseudomallei]|uniref:hypothetical protein n=1 Tax=Burkholderia pseudomallei TaxID=28450 RepID=UPI002DBA6E36|nr:hypothetical protein [Burkholderia pseudomallei]MEB5487985.1 hypothetical protein [Burkholderia pseudomallei]MEB5494564.1 hypothetical protein [Burkholderia pseudomallei]MEB5501072.1 hypothetical protein [Burkholderia pseudomallei]MEB5506865.1 hypothetical protein [Burkholderia pseudomallei]MEB5513992.1 hypothetical protein [Burkholderia pseudomallei]
MNNKKQCLVLGALVVVAAALAGCSGGPSKGDLKDGLAQYFKDKPQAVCWNVENSAAVQWPLRVPMQGMTKDQLGVLDGLNREGIATVQEGLAQQGFTNVTVLTINLTDKGKSANAWDPQKGFCVGTKAVDQVTEFTIPNKDSEGTSEVKFTWKLDDVPSWVERDKFPKLPGMTASVNDEAVMAKTNNGWRVQ